MHISLKKEILMTFDNTSKTSPAAIVKKPNKCILEITISEMLNYVV